MIIDSPIISGSYSASGSLNQFGNVVISGSLTVTGSIIGTASFAETASYLSGYVSPFPFTGSAIISGSLDVTGSLKVTGSITTTGTLTAQTLVVQTVSSSVIYSSGSNVFGNDLANTQVLTGSVSITGSLAVNGSNAILTNQTSSMSASYATSASYALNATSASYAANATTASYANNSTSASYAADATTASYATNATSASYANNATSASYALTASFSLNVPVTSSYANNANSASYALSASFATTASYLTGYISPFPFTGSAIISGSLAVTGSVAVSNLSGSGVRYLVADESGSITAQSASAALKSTQAFTSTAGQTTFSVTNGYSTGYVDVFINGSKLATAEFTDTSGTNIVLATGSFINDTVEVVKYTPALGVTNNVLRQLTTFTASAAQTVFSASYTPGLIDIFYNGSRLSPADFTANNGTFFTLATGSAANDILDVLVYSYQVGAFSGIGGVGTADQIAFFGTTNSITGSPNFTISGSTMLITGSLTISGSSTFTNIGPAVFSGSLTSTAGFTGSFSGTATSASYAANADLLDGLDSSVFTLTSSFAAQTASFTAFTSSILSYTASQNILNGTYATTGSNTFAGIQTINSNLIVTGSITAQTLVVQTITSSVDFVTGSTRFGSILGNTHQFTGSVSITGSMGIGVAAGTNGTKFISAGSATSFFDAAGTRGISIYPSSAGNIHQITSDYIATSYYSIAITARGTNSDLFISSSGNVGIGTSGPLAKLHVETSTATDGIYLSRSTSNKQTILLSADDGVGAYIAGNTTPAGNASQTDGAGRLILQGGSTEGFQFQTSYVTGGTAASWTTRMRITNAGNVVINSTVANYKFQVNSGISTSTATVMTLQQATNGAVKDAAGFGLAIQNGGEATNAADLIISTASGGSLAERMRITNGGYLFFGTTTNSGFSSTSRFKGPSSTENTDIISIDGGIEYSGYFRAVSGANYSSAGTAIIIGRNTSTGRSINAGGTINASGADYAEYMLKAIQDNISKGDIVGVNENGLLTNIFADAKSFVVKSTNPSYVGGDTWGSVDIIGKLPTDATDEQRAEYEVRLEEARAKVDRIAFSGQVPCNVYNAQVGDYIIPIELDGKISGQAVSNPTFEQYQLSVGKVWKIMEDGRAWVAVKIG